MVVEVGVSCVDEEALEAVLSCQGPLTANAVVHCFVEGTFAPCDFQEMKCFVQFFLVYFVVGRQIAEVVQGCWVNFDLQRHALAPQLVFVDPEKLALVVAESVLKGLHVLKLLPEIIVRFLVGIKQQRFVHTAHKGKSCRSFGMGIPG